MSAIRSLSSSLGLDPEGIGHHVRVQDVLNSIADPYLFGRSVRDTDGRIVDLSLVDANSAARLAAGIPPGDLANALLSDVFGPEDIRALLSDLDTMDPGEPLSLDDYRLSPLTARTKTTRSDVRVTQVDGSVAITWHDVTKLYEQRKKFELLMSHSADVVLVSQDGLLDWVSPGIADLLGWTVAELVGTSGDGLVHPDDRHRMLESRAQNAQGLSTQVRLRYLRRDGGYVWCDAHARSVHDDELGGLRIVVTLRDISSSIALEQARDRSDARYRLVAEHSSDVVYTTDRMHCFNWVSPSMATILGWTPDELVGTPTDSLLDPVDPADPDLLSDLRHRLYDEGGATEPFKVRYRTKSGGTRWMSVSTLPVTEDKGLGVGAVVTLRDCQDEVLERRAADTLSAGNGLLAVAEDEKGLLGAMCETAVAVGGYRFAWYGRCAPTNDGTPGERVVPVASSGGFQPYLDRLDIRTANTRTGRGSAGRAACTGHPAVESDMETDAATASWSTQDLGQEFRSSASFPVIIEGSLDGVFSVYASEPDAFDEHSLSILEDLATTLGYGVARVRERNELHRSFVSAIDLVAAVVESRDPYTAGHQALAAELARAIGEELGLDPHRLDGLSLGARIHDVGKVGVPIDILCRPGVLAPEELAVVRRHSTIGWEIAGHFDWPWPVADIIHQHHERFDGSGYPQGLVGDDILLEARIVAVADAFQAIAARRPYRAALGVDRAFAIIVDGAGTQFDPTVVDAFVRVLNAGFQFSLSGTDEA